MSIVLRPQFPNVFEREPNLSLVNILRRKNNDCTILHFLAVSCYFRYQCQQSTLFSSTYATDGHKQAVVIATLKIYKLRSGSPLLDPFFDPSRL